MGAQFVAKIASVVLNRKYVCFPPGLTLTKVNVSRGSPGDTANCTAGTLDRNVNNEDDGQQQNKTFLLLNFLSNENIHLYKTQFKM